ncbi:MAG: glycosyltransferase family 39 protein [Flavobacteriales bacterium]
MTTWARANYSLITLAISVLFIVVYRLLNVHTHEISWDAFGYYLYLPSIFIHGDFLLNDISWIHQANETYHLTDTLYQLSASPSGEPMYFFLMGMSLFYLPFFFIAHLVALSFGFESDGFSAPYQYSLAIGCISYTIIGLVYLRKLLIKYFGDKAAGLTILLMVFGTNVIHHLTIKNLETVNVLFMLAVVSVYCIDRFYQYGKPRYLIISVIAAALMILVKPSEGVIIVLLLCWNACTISGLRGQLSQLLSHWKTLCIAGFGVILMAAPQLWYWYSKTGHLLYDSYVNPGVGLDFFSPHIWDVLFSYRKGWFVYTPLIAFVLAGLIWLTTKKPSLGLPIVVFVALELWVVSSWTEWWYGAAFSCRPMIVTYPFIAFGLAYFLERLFNFKSWARLALGTFIGLAALLSLFKYWQQEVGILDPYRMTGEYYWSTFLDTEWNASKQRLLLVRRTFDGNAKLQFPEYYGAVELSNAQSVAVENEFFSLLRTPYEELSDKDHVWIEVVVSGDSVLVRDELYIVSEMVREEGSYGYHAQPIDLSENHADTIRYLTPEVRDEADMVHVYIWNRNLKKLRLASVSILVLERDSEAK